MKQSLWDLKLTDGIQLLANYGIMKQSLWDLKLRAGKGHIDPVKNHEAVPMGFETWG